MFVNLSNHPSKEWSQAQLLAAEEVGGEVMDVPFPDISPAASLDEVRLQARGLASRIMELHPVAAMVHGEPVLVCQTVRLMEAAGIRCYAATTRRIVTEEKAGEGVTRKTSHFEFVQFRPYQ